MTFSPTQEIKAKMKENQQSSEKKVGLMLNVAKSLPSLSNRGKTNNNSGISGMINRH